MTELDHAFEIILEWKARRMLNADYQASIGAPSADGSFKVGAIDAMVYMTWLPWLDSIGRRLIIPTGLHMLFGKGSSTGSATAVLNRRRRRHPVNRLPIPVVPRRRVSNAGRVEYSSVLYPPTTIEQREQVPDRSRPHGGRHMILHG